MSTVLKTVREYFFGVLTFFWRLSVHIAKFGKMHGAVTIMAADNRVRQFPEGYARSYLANYHQNRYFTVSEGSASIGAPLVRH